MSRIALWFLPLSLIAAPSGEQVKQGECAFERSRDVLTVSQSTDRAVIHWNDFSIASGEMTRFLQPSRDSVSINRVVSDKLSAIHGTLEANGRVYLINANGIAIGPEGIVRAGGFLASTLHLHDEIFSKDSEHWFSGDSGGMISNEGSVEGADGVHFISREIRNSGLVSSPEGPVSFGAGTEVLIKPFGKNWSIRVKGEGTLDHNGTIEAAQAELRAAGTNFEALAVNSEGVIHAKGVLELDGRVILSSEKEGIVRHSGTIRSENSDGSGGAVHLLGHYVQLTGAARVDASGKTAGGEILAGGDYKGKEGPIRKARALYVSPDACADVSCIGCGDGGKAIFWGDLQNHFYGSALALGGTEGGNGGLVEVSSRGLLEPRGTVRTTAPLGKTGIYLIDPVNVNISGAATTALVVTSPPACPGPGTSSYTVTAPGFSPVTINGGDLGTALDCSNIIIDAAVMAGGDVGTVTISTAVSWMSDNDLTINARDIVLSAGTDLSNTGAGSVTMNANFPASFLGSFTGISGTKSSPDPTVLRIQMADGDITLNANGGTTGGEGIQLAAAAGGLGACTVSLTTTGTGNVLINGSSPTSNGVRLRGVVNLDNFIVTSTSGTVTIQGNSTAAAGANHGVSLVHRVFVTGGTGITIQGSTAAVAGVGVISTIESTLNSGGDIMMTGTSPFRGIQYQSTGITTSGSGSITLSGTGGSAEGTSLDVGSITSVNGDILIMGSGTRGISLLRAGPIPIHSSGIGNVSIQGTGTTLQGVLGTSDTFSPISISAGSGDVTISGTSGSNRGVDFIGPTLGGSTFNLLQTSSGAINITGTSSGANDGIHLRSTVVANGSGSATLTGSSASATGIFLEAGLYATTIGRNVGGGYFSPPPATVAVSTGPITLAADTLSLLANSVITTGAVALHPLSAATSIGVGTGVGTVNYSNALLGQIGPSVPSQIIIGQASGAHTINVNGGPPANRSYLFRGETVNIDNFNNGASPIGFNIGMSGTGLVDLGNTITSGVITVTGFGSPANNTLQAQDIANTWNVTSADAGNINGAGFLNFTNIGNLVGGNQPDTFIFSDQQGVSGLVDGGAPPVPNILDYTAFTIPAIVDPIGLYDGTASNIGNGYFNIGSVIGNFMPTPPPPPPPPPPPIVPAVVVPVFFSQQTVEISNPYLFLNTFGRDDIFSLLQSYLLSQAVSKDDLFRASMEVFVFYQTLSNGLNDIREFDLTLPKTSPWIKGGYILNLP